MVLESIILHLQISLAEDLKVPGDSDATQMKNEDAVLRTQNAEAIHYVAHFSGMYTLSIISIGSLFQMMRATPKKSTNISFFYVSQVEK